MLSGPGIGFMNAALNGCTSESEHHIVGKHQRV